MNLHQISVSYEPDQDRLLLRVRGSGGEHFSVWLTRRVMRGLRPAFQQASGHLAATALASPAVATPEARAMLADSARSQALGKSDFSRPFEAEAAAHPMGPAPLLPARIDLHVQSDQKIRFALIETPERTLQLELVQQDWEALRHMFDQAIAKADWDLAPLPDPAVAEVRPSLLN